MTITKDRESVAAAPQASRSLADQAWLLMMLTGLFWAGNAIVGKAVAGEVPPIGLAFWRWTIASAIALPFAWRHLRNDVFVMLRAWRFMVLASLFGIAVFNSFLYTAAQTTSAINIVMLQSVMPVLIVGATFLILRETVTSRQAAGIVVSMLGALTLIAKGNPSALLHLDFAPGDLWMLAAAVSYSIYTAMLRKRPPVHGLSFLVGTFVIGAAMLVPFYLAETFSGRPVPITPHAGLAIAYVGIFPSILAYLCFNRSVALVGPNTAGLSIHFVPVFGTVLAVLLLGEVPQAYQGAGIVLIALGVWLATRAASAGRVAASASRS